MGDSETGGWATALTRALSDRSSERTRNRKRRGLARQRRHLPNVHPPSVRVLAACRFAFARRAVCATHTHSAHAVTKIIATFLVTLQGTTAATWFRYHVQRIPPASGVHPMADKKLNSL